MSEPECPGERSVPFFVSIQAHFHLIKIRQKQHKATLMRCPKDYAARRVNFPANCQYGAKV